MRVRWMKHLKKGGQDLRNIMFKKLKPNDDLTYAMKKTSPIVNEFF